MFPLFVSGAYVGVAGVAIFAGVFRDSIECETIPSVPMNPTGYGGEKTTAIMREERNIQYIATANMGSVLIAVSPPGDHETTQGQH